ncbi:LamG-like jellyroll fold domain-containing protein [Actinomadura syzygii]|uniref:LamG domain-containing protein n=1 Tax=Actinomadura syzygii TaxID=1427538 RepID=A0A5D0UDY7_9ACTN|nr:LamG domain-containing protein [Actinomadura syzygii]TYC15872.1 LamG domain-containing protein [Actinomadura syzygii]
MAKLPELPKLRIAGPFWTAEADVIRLADPATNYAFRTLFVDMTPRGAIGEDDVLLPGSWLALVYVTSVTISPTGGSTPQYVWKRSGTKPDGHLPPQAIRAAISAGTASLLLLQAPADGWPANIAGKLPTFTCLGGEIVLDPMTAQNSATQKLYTALGIGSAAITGRTGAARLLGALAVHAGGLSAFGQVRLLWDSAPVNAVFQLARVVPDPEPTPGTKVRGFRMTIEAERLTDAERAAIIASWRRLNRYLNPNNPLNGLVEPVPAPEWATLELANPLTIPRLFWEIAPWQEQPGTRPISFAGDEFSVLLSDRRPYDPSAQPDTLARITPTSARVAVDGTNLRMELKAGGPPAAATGTFSYQASRDAAVWSERVTLGATTLAFDPNEAARRLRATLQVPEPSWSPPPPGKTGPVTPTVLWGFTPLDDGWAQLPLPNLSEQIYLDAGVAQAEPVPAPDNLLRGAVSFGNDDPSGLGQFPGEQPWSLTLAAAQRMTATWVLGAITGGYQLQSADLALDAPEVALNGLYWLSTEAPTAADALPDFDDWIGGLTTVPLHTVTRRELFAPLVRLAFEAISFAWRSKPAPSAGLGPWAFQYGVDPALLRALVNSGALPSDVVGAALPLVWRRHPSLPMVQALALTQSVTPPNVPIAGRQLVPFELPVTRQDGLDLPNGWRFTAEGATGWPLYAGGRSPAREWLGSDEAKLYDLPLVALSLPGLVLDPRPDGDPPQNDLALGLPVQYRYDLPYTDEVQALAQLPKIPKDPRESTPLPDTARPEPPRPLSRADYADHWRRLAERADLAAADDVAAFARQDGQTVLRHLASVHAWAVRATLDLEGYPGELRLDNADPAASAPLTLAGEAALPGVGGDFADGAGGLRRLPADAPPDSVQYRLTAGSMAAGLTGDARYADQRGLARGASVPASNLIRTPVSHPTGGDVQLTTTRSPLTLGHSTASWQLWFRDLPAQGTTFTKASARSPRAVDLDLDSNDPEARSSDYEHRTGYEWRLRPLDDDPDAPAPGLDLFGLQFFPLVLDRVVFDGDGVAKVEVIGRLQLPVAGSGAEQIDLSNCVRLTFSASSGGAALNLSAVGLVGDVLEWPLAVSAGEAGDAPRLRVGGIALASGGAGLTVQQVRLYFHLFRVEWAVGLPPISFPNPATPPFTLPGANGPDPIVPQKVALGLDMTGGAHTLNLTIAVRVGRPPSDLQALYRFDEGSGGTVHDSSGTGDPLHLTAASTQGMSWGTSGLTLTKPTLIRSGAPATKLTAAVKASNEISVEAWVKPVTGLLTNGQFNIVTVSADDAHRNVTVQQRKGLLESSFVDVWLRTSTTSEDGAPDLATDAGSLGADLTHVAYTRSADGKARIYINGEPAADDGAAGTLAAWNDQFELALGDEFTGGHAWLGTYRMLAVYSRALSAEEVSARFASGPATAPPTATVRGEAIAAALTFNLMAGGADRFTLDTATLFGDLTLGVTLPDGSPAALAGDTALQFSWNGYSAPQPEKLQFLPGMRLADAQTPGLRERAAPGFATVTFRATARPDDIPKLPLTGAFVEALLLAHWGRSLHDVGPNGTAQAAELYGSSAGDLVVGYTSRLQGSGVHSSDWQETFLINGMLAATNLVSWPQQLNYDAGNARITLPAARTAGAPPLTHLRHTIRVLLNQHEVPGSALTGAQGPLLFTFAQGQSWQTLGLVEHQLVEVTPGADGSGGTLGREARWTAVQEVRLLAPQRAARFLRAMAARETTDPVEGVSPLGSVGGGYLAAGLSALLADSGAALDALPPDTLIVEASAHHLVRLTPVADGAATTLQFLPTGSQGAQLSSPADYAPSDPTDPRWLLLTMPFLGRLQDPARDLAQPAAGQQPSALRTDPVLLISRLRASAPTTALPSLALVLSGWADNTPIAVTLAGLDTAVGRSFARLDSVALEESWFRAQNPSPEPQDALLQSILAALPETPARLSRPVALRQAFDPRRPFYPPRPGDQPALAEPSPYADPVWREDGLLLTQSVSTVSPTNKPPYGWTLAAALIASSGLLSQPPAGGQGPRRYPAATLIPAPLKLAGADNPRPLSLVVSPYLGLQWRPAPAVPATGASPLQTRLLLAELLCLAPSTMRLQPVASRMWSVQPDNPELADEAHLRAQAQGWAVQSQRLLAPESPIAVLRYRTISDNTRPDNLGEAALTTGYAFALVRVTAASPLAKRLFRIRPELAGLRYREGQCNIAAIPATPRDFELAPPQTVGVQPLYLTQRPVREDLPAWPWGLSALRVSVHYTKGEQGVVGAATPGASGQTLWWQTVQRTVQFRSALHTDRPASGLPRRFRAPAVSSLLPAPPNPPLPALTGPVFDQPALPEPDDQEPGVPAGLALERWQPVLPGGLRYLVSGARAGVFVTLRHHLLRQSGITLAGERPRPRGLGMLSGGLPVEHRAPRPVPLPANADGRQGVALRTWASHFDPGRLALVTASPADEAFRADFNDPPENPTYRQTAQRLRLHLAAVERYTLDVGWDGVLTFVYRIDGSIPLVGGQKPDIPESGIRDWGLALELVAAGQVTALDDITTPTLALTPALRAQLGAVGVPLPGPDVDTVDTAKLAIRQFGLAGDAKARADKARELIAALPPGAAMLARAKARFVPHHPGAEPYHDGYSHVLGFPLRVADPNAPFLPLAPRHVHFEDPEYNRRLASPSAHVSVPVQFPQQPGGGTSPQRVVTLSAERRECNPDSTLALRFDWDEPPPGSPRVTLTLQKIDLDQTPRDLVDPDATGGPVQLDPGKLHELSLAALQKLNGPFTPGERLRLVLHVDSGPVKPAVAVLDITIVEAPVIPATEAAYALLRGQTVGESTHVECPRFAWGPEAQRVELVNPADLRTEVVRRRAVFQYTDSTRPGRAEVYAIQKVSQAGSTHIPLHST